MPMQQHLRRIALLTLVASPALLAHPGHGDTGLVAGAMHPLLGWDHLLAMVAVGLMAVRCGGRALWGLPLLFMASMLVGGLLALAGVPMPGAEWGIAASVLVFGVIVALAHPPHVALAGAIVALFALLHGHAHAAEMHADQQFALYAAGFLASTAVLHAAGVLGGLALTRVGSVGAVRLTGAGIAACSGFLVIGLLA